MGGRQGMVLCQPGGLWKEHEIIFSRRHFPEGCLSFDVVPIAFLSQCLTGATSQTCRTSLHLLSPTSYSTMNASVCHIRPCSVGFTPHTRTVRVTLCMGERIPPSLCLPCLSLTFVLEEEMSRCEKLRGVVCSENNTCS